MTEMTDLQKLAIRLDHWIDHNADHAREFQHGAATANDLGLHAVRDEILLAAENLDVASEHLRRASEELGQ
jgi:hypothetical protein